MLLSNPLYSILCSVNMYCIPARAKTVCASSHWQWFIISTMATDVVLRFFSRKPCRANMTSTKHQAPFHTHEGIVSARHRLVRVRIGTRQHDGSSPASLDEHPTTPTATANRRTSDDTHNDTNNGGGGSSGNSSRAHAPSLCR